MSGRFTLFKKTLLSSILAVAFFSIIFGFISFWISRQFQNENPQTPSGVNYAKMLSQINIDRRVEALETISETASGSRAKFWLLDEKGMPLFPKDAAAPELESKMVFPQEVYEYKNSGKSSEGPSAVVVKLSGTPIQYLMITYRGPGIRRRQLFFSSTSDHSFSPLF